MRGTTVRSEVDEIIRRARAVVFDFDGTLVDSTAIKWRAFDRCFMQFPARQAEIQAYCRGHHHTPRWEKFRHVYERILGLPYTLELEAKLLAVFDQESTEHIIAAREIPGAARLVCAVAARRMTGLLSSTPHATLLHLVEQRGWRPWFTFLQGAPVHKASWLAQCKAAHALARQELVFFGDAPEDAQAAEEAGCLFVAVGAALHGAAPHWLADFTALSAR
jgi:phosphoglycolate phosphatase-like HAD superfamily hydrolase